MASGYHDIIEALKGKFYQDSSGNVYEIDNLIKGSQGLMIECYRLRKEGGLERVHLPIERIFELENVGKREDFADSKGIIKYKHVLEKIAQSKKSEMPNPVKGLSLSLFPIKDSC